MPCTMHPYCMQACATVAGTMPCTMNPYCMQACGAMTNLEELVVMFPYSDFPLAEGRVLEEDEVSWWLVVGQGLVWFCPIL